MVRSNGGRVAVTAEQSDKLMKARCRLLTREPWYGHIAMSMVWIPSNMPWLPEHRRTMGVRIVNGGEVQCLYYPPFVDSMTVKECFAVIQHEIEHIVRLHCLRVSGRDPDGWNIACCKPDELIVGGGDKAIGELTAGDAVYGRVGREVEVVAPMRRHHRGKMVRLKGRFLLPFSVTPEHPVLVAPWKLRTTGKPKTTIKEYGEPEFVEAGKLVGCASTRGQGPARSGFALVVPKYAQTINSRHLDLSDFVARYGDGSIRTEVLNLDGDMAWLMGLYVAEGSACSADFSAGVQWSLSANEVELAAEIQRILGAYGFSPRVDIDGTRVRVQVTSPILARAFADWFGQGAAQKRVPGWIRHHSDRGLILSFLAGYFAGDGHNSESKSGVRNSAGTVSRLLALQIQMLGFTHDIPFGLYESNRGTRALNGTTLPPERLFVMESGGWQARELFKQTPGRQRNHHFDAGGCVYVPLLEVDDEDYDGPVCNVETTDHTYLVSNAVVHNCDMTVNGPRNKPRIGYHESTTAEIIVPFKSDIIWIPEDWAQDGTAEHYYDLLEKKQKQLGPTCPNCGRSHKGQGQQSGSGSGKGKKKDKGQQGEGGQGQPQPGQGGQPDPNTQGQPQPGSRCCPSCGQENDGSYNYGGVHGKSIDDHSVWNQTDVSQDEARQVVKDMVDQATAKCQGHVPGHLVEAIQQLAKPVVRWRELLRYYLGKHVGNQRKTFSRRNRRHDRFGVPGTSHHAAATVNVIVDTSGSIGSRELEQFFAEIDAIASRAKVNVLLWDHAFQGWATYRRGDWKHFKVHGRGGTDMAAPVQWLIDQKLIADVQVMLTDGLCNYHEPCEFPMITVITTPEGTTNGPGWGHEVRLRND
jgi:predicted metal-dependent peptidase